MIPRDCKRLAEVDFPISLVSKHAAREKSIRHGNPSTLHVWWARRPLAACRALILALLLPDPCDSSCPVSFKQQAAKLLASLPGTVPHGDFGLRQALLQFIGDISNWDLSSNTTYLEVARTLIRLAHGESEPLVFDAFAGGGSIPLEAIRLGCDAFASDLNPVAWITLKALLEEIPRFGPELADDLRKTADQVSQLAADALSDLYPRDKDRQSPVIYIWARTARCEAPNCGAEFPLVRTFWLQKKGAQKKALKFSISRGQSRAPKLEFHVFTPKAASEVATGTIRRSKATCPCCHTSLSPDRVRAQLSRLKGGSDPEFSAERHRIGGAMLLAVLTSMSGSKTRSYRDAKESDYEVFLRSTDQVLAFENQRETPSPFPDEPVRRVPVSFGVINVWVYGMEKWGNLFNARQKLTLFKIYKIISELPEQTARERAIKLLSTLAVSRFSDDYSALTRWMDRGTPAALAASDRSLGSARTASCQRNFSPTVFWPTKTAPQDSSLRDATDGS